MPPTKFGLNQTKGSGADVVLRFSRWPPRIAERNNLSNSESLCCSDASYQVSAHPTYGLEGGIV